MNFPINKKKILNIFFYSCIHLLLFIHLFSNLFINWVDIGHWVKSIKHALFRSIKFALKIHIHYNITIKILLFFKAVLKAFYFWTKFNAITWNSKIRLPEKVKIKFRQRFLNLCTWHAIFRIRINQLNKLQKQHSNR